MAFATRFEPDHVVVHAYRALDGLGEPTNERASTFECEAGSRACSFLDLGDEMLLAVPFAVDAPYVVVFAVWHVPVADVVDGGSPTASASWIFRLGQDAAS